VCKNSPEQTKVSRRTFAKSEDSEAEKRKSAQNGGSASALSDAEALRRDPTSKNPLQLFEACSAAETEARKFSTDTVKPVLAKLLFFGKPLFEPAPLMDDASAINKEVALKIRRQLWEAGKYRDLLVWLGECKSRDARLFIIAWWLAQENVCQPEDILGSKRMGRMVRKNLGFLSKSEFRHADAVRVWLPYFEQLIVDMRQRNGDELFTLGYEQGPVDSAKEKRSSVAAACAWLASRNNADVSLFTKAFSKIYGPKHLRRRAVDVPA
jgi:hypothetical protein